MSRIPSGRLAPLDPNEVPLANASRRVLKSRRLSAELTDFLIEAPAFAGPISHTRSGADSGMAAVRDASPESETASVQRAVNTAERNFELRLATGIKQARAEAHAEGLAEGLAAVSGGVEELKASLNEAIAGLSGARESFAEQSEPLIAELGFRLAEAILGSPLPEHIRLISTTSLSDAIERIGEADSVQVTVHPADFMALTENGLVAQIGQNHPGLSWRTDAGLERGDWEARSNSAVIRRVALEMLADTRERLSHADSNDSSTV